MSTNFLEKVKSDLQDTAKDVTQILKETSNKVGEATLKAADKIGDGHSSKIFWCLLCIEHSLSPK